jgi:hypothetical protein
MRPRLVLALSRCFYQNKTTFLSNNFTKSFLSFSTTVTARFTKMPTHKLLASTAEPPIGEFSEFKCSIMR